MRFPALQHLLVTASICAVVLAALDAGASAQNYRWRVGQRAPDLRLPTIDGERTLDLREFRGVKVLLIEFASW